MKMHKTKVIFRTWRDTKEVIAIFPDIPADHNPHSCLSYLHIGQHGGCSPHLVIAHTTLSTENEYAKRYSELIKDVGYDLKIIKRYNQSVSFYNREQKN